MIAPVYVCYLLQPAAGTFHDDGVYLVNAFSLATGHGYRTISLPMNLYQTKLPFLHPVLLALVWKLFPVFPANLVALRMLSLSATVLWAYTTYRLALREMNDSILARWIAVMLLTFPWVLFLSTTTMPETLFGVTSTASLLMFDRNIDAPRGWRLLAGAVLAGASFLFRSAGIALIISWLFLLFRRKQWISAMIFFLVVATLVGPWLAWQGVHPATNDPVGAYYTKLNYQTNSVLSSHSAAHMFRVIALNAVVALISCCPLSALGSNFWSAIFSLLAGLVCVGGWIGYASKRGLTLPIVWFAASLAMILCMMFGLVRYQVPLLAVTLILFGNGIMILLGYFRRHAVTGAIAVLAVCSIGNVADLFTLRRLTIQRESPTWTITPADSWSKTMQTVSWLHQNISRNAVVGANCDPIIFLYSGRKAIRLFSQDNYKLFFDASPNKLPLGSPERLKSHLKANRISYIVMTPMAHYPEAPFLRKQLESLMLASPAAFHVAKRFDDPEFYILKVDRSKL
ncbi:MAG TPA: hypothetical protein VH369_12150 [Bryobacteraceae bacterium]